MIEVRNLFAQMKIFEKRRAALSAFERVRVVVYRETLVGRQAGSVGHRGYRREYFDLLVA